MLDVWPDSTIVIKQYDSPTLGMDNIDPVREIILGMVAISPFQVVFAVTQVPFPARIRLNYLPEHETVPIAPDSLLGESAPHLRSLYLGRIPFSGFPQPLLSATNLVHLTLHHVPHSGYISPETMTSCLSTLTKLEFLGLDFESPRSYPDQERLRPPLPKCSVLPALTQLEFRGVSEYLEDFVARIDAPLLNKLYIFFFHQLILGTPHLAHFISRTPKFKAHNEAQIMFFDDAVQLLLGSMQQVILRTACKPSDWQLSFMAQVCKSLFSLTTPSLEHLYICEDIHSRSHWQRDIDNSQWVDILQPCTAVKNLYLSEEIVPRIAPAVQELVGEGVTEVLPAMKSLFLEEPHLSGLVEGSHPSKTIKEAITKFTAVRQLSLRPTDSRRWRKCGTSVISQRFTGLFN